MDPYHLHSGFSQLVSLIRRGHFEDVAELLREQPELLKLRDRTGRSALHHCADSCPASVASIRPGVVADIGQLLLRMQPTMVEWQDVEGHTPFHLAVINGQLALLKRMLSIMRPGQVDIADYELHTAVHWAVVSGQLEALAAVLEHGANPHTPDIYGAYPVHYATQNGLPGLCPAVAAGLRRSPQPPGTSSLPELTYSHRLAGRPADSQRRVNSLRILHHLLTSRPHLDVNCLDNERRTPLIWAASTGNHDALLVLVKAGAEISQQDQDGLSALHCAASRGHYKCLHTLITMCGADVHQLDSGGCTPLFYAVALGHADCVRLLIQCGASLDHQDHKGRTAAHCGASKGQLETLKILYEHGAKLWLKNARGDLPLHDAVKSGRVDLVKWFLEQSPDSVNEVNLYGRSAMHIAAFNHNLDMCHLLANYGADLNPVMKVRSQYLTPLDAALQNGSGSSDPATDRLVEWLRAHGAQPFGQIDRHVAEYLRCTDDANGSLITPESVEESRFRMTSSHSPLAAADASQQVLPKRSKSKPPRDRVKIDEELPVQVGGQTVPTKRHRKSRSKPDRIKSTEVDVEPPAPAPATTTKLPNLVQQSSGEKRAASTQSSSSRSSASSGLSETGTPNSVVHSAKQHTAHHHHHSSRVKNVREFETILDGHGDPKHATHLKQAIITNVYLTASSAPTAALAPIEATEAVGLMGAAGTAVLPIYYVKRVPPLKKLSGQKRSKKLNGKTKKARMRPDAVSVVMEAHDTLESGDGIVREQKTLVEEELTLSKEQHDENRGFQSKQFSVEIEDQQPEQEQDEPEDEEEDEKREPELQPPEPGAIESENDEIGSRRTEDEGLEVGLEEATPDSGFETMKEPLKLGDPASEPTKSEQDSAVSWFDSKISAIDTAVEAHHHHSDRDAPARSLGEQGSKGSEPDDPTGDEQDQDREQDQGQDHDSEDERRKRSIAVPETAIEERRKSVESLASRASSAPEQGEIELAAPSPDPADLRRGSILFIHHVEGGAQDEDSGESRIVEVFEYETEPNQLESDNRQQDEIQEPVIEKKEVSFGPIDEDHEPTKTTEKQQTDESEMTAANQGEPEPSAPTPPPEPETTTIPVSHENGGRRGSYTKSSSAEEAIPEDDATIVSREPAKADHPAGHPEAFVSSFGPVRQLKGKKKSYDHVRPKVDSYWSEHYHHRGDRSPSTVSRRAYKRSEGNEYLATTSHEEYARIDPHFINQTVEKYLRKYYLERKLFEELYDLKRYQIRTGKSNEPQLVKRLVEKFRRDTKAPGMVDFRGPFTYRAYEMYLYDLLRQLSRSNQKKIAYLTKSMSFEDLESSFDHVNMSSDENRGWRRARAGETSDFGRSTAGPDRADDEKYASDVSSESELNDSRRRQSATTRHRGQHRKDPLFDYDRRPYGLVLDYKYEYHKSQHRACSGDTTIDGGEGLVDVICENLYKRTGMHGTKIDEMAVSRKIIEKAAGTAGHHGGEARSAGADPDPAGGKEP